jgi:hypothetical protein
VSTGRALVRSLSLVVVSAGERRWRVTGGEREHTVRAVRGRLVCDCRAAWYRRREPCKHVLAVRLAATPAEVVAGIRELAGWG